jgi:hypothetical protein
VETVDAHLTSAVRLIGEAEALMAKPGPRTAEEVAAVHGKLTAAVPELKSAGEGLADVRDALRTANDSIAKLEKRLAGQDDWLRRISKIAAVAGIGFAVFILFAKAAMWLRIGLTGLSLPMSAQLVGLILGVAPWVFAVGAGAVVVFGLVTVMVHWRDLDFWPAIKAAFKG